MAIGKERGVVSTFDCGRVAFFSGVIAINFSLRQRNEKNVGWVSLASFTSRFVRLCQTVRFFNKFPGIKKRLSHDYQ
jgi:hypothetical protein